MRDCSAPAYHRTCWDSGGKDCCSRALPRRSRSSRPLVPAEGLGEDVPASALSGGAATALSSLLSDDWGKERTGRAVHQHQPRDPGRFLPCSVLFLHPPLPRLPARYLEAVPAAAVGSRGGVRCWVVQACQRGKKDTWSQATKWVRALNGA